MTTFLKALGNLFRKPATVQYPFEPTYLPDTYRGLIKHNPEKCIGCLKCEMVCPPGAIVFSEIMGEKKKPYHYNTHVCIYCGECVRACPVPGALIQTNEMAPPVTAAAKINHSWNDIVKNAKASREACAAERRKEAAAKAAAAAAAKAAAEKKE